ncbi:hypothetical protein SNE40_017436 [Patella caerulea]|uniref:Uncharacterized protein n=1 Tax=Patella caerulea TaxID=87958 RepID=A0AAN8JDZ5_PATCE
MEVSSLEEVATCVKRSSPVAGVNIPQCVGYEATNISVPLFDWQAYISPFFKPLDGIKNLQHLRFDGRHRGSVFGKETTDGEERTVKLLKNIAELSPGELPEIVLPPGLDDKRQWYLFTQIREFCSEGTRDTVCPRPVCPYVVVEYPDEEVQEPPAMKKKAVKKAPTHWGGGEITRVLDCKFMDYVP